MDEIDNNADLQSAINTKQKFIPMLHVNLDDYDSSLWDEFFIGAVPTLILFEHGKVRKRLDGKMGFGINKRQLYDWLKDL